MVYSEMFIFYKIQCYSICDNYFNPTDHSEMSLLLLFTMVWLEIRCSRMRDCTLFIRYRVFISVGT